MNFNFSQLLDLKGDSAPFSEGGADKNLDTKTPS